MQWTRNKTIIIGLIAFLGTVGTVTALSGLFSNHITGTGAQPSITLYLNGSTANNTNPDIGSTVQLTAILTDNSTDTVTFHNGALVISSPITPVKGANGSNATITYTLPAGAYDFYATT